MFRALKFKVDHVMWPRPFQNSLSSVSWDLLWSICYLKCLRLLSTKMWKAMPNVKILVLSHPFVGLRGNAQGSSMALWKVHCWLPINKPRVGPGYPFPPLLLHCPFTSSSFALYYFFPFSFSNSLYLFFSIVHPIPFYQNHPTLFPSERS